MFSWKPNLKYYFDAISPLYETQPVPITGIQQQKQATCNDLQTVLGRNFFPQVLKLNLVKFLARLLPFSCDLLIFGTPALHELLEDEQSPILSFVLFKQLFNPTQSVLHPLTLFGDVAFNWSLSLRVSGIRCLISCFCCWHSVSLGNGLSWIEFDIQVLESGPVVSLSDTVSENFRFCVLDVESRFGDELWQGVVFQAPLQWSVYMSDLAA
jgi:hypothetical protein